VYKRQELIAGFREYKEQGESEKNLCH